MKRIKTLLLMAACCLGISTQAQIVCGINQAYFYWANNPNNVPVFHDTSSYAQGWAPVSYVWDFGDGTTSTLAAPSHVYANPGNYTVCMTVTAQLQGSSITCSATYCKPYSNCGGMVVATFTSTQQGGGTVNFIGSASGNYPPFSYVWDFGDGSTGTGTTPTHTYTSVGSYYVCLYVTDTNGCSGSYCQTIYVTSALCNMNASFTVSNPTQSAVVLTSVTSGANANTLYQWWMDGVALTNPNPNTAYTITGVTTGLHTFCLYVYANANTFCDSTCGTSYIQNGSNPCGTMQASFTANSDPNGLVTLQSTSTNALGGTWYQWWMDGSPLSPASAGLQNFSASNVSSGIHQFCLYLFSPQNSQYFCDSACQNVLVQNSNPCAGINTQFTDSIQGNVGVFTAGSNTASVMHYWTIDHTAVGSGSTFTYTFPSNTNTVVYSVCHIVYVTGTSCVDSTCTQITIPGSGTCNLNAVYTYTASGTTYNFIGNYSNSSSYQQYWLVNGSIVGQGGSFSYQFAPSTTSADVCYYVSIPGTICADTFCQTIQVQNSGCAGVVAYVNTTTNPNGGYNLDVTFNGTIVQSYQWSNGATTATIHVTAPGAYCVTVVDINGCSAVGCDSVGGNTGCNMQSYISTQNSASPWVLQAHAFGGTAPYTYAWSNGQSNSSILTVTTAGTYCVVIYDALQCVTSACYTVNSSTAQDTLCGVVFEDVNGNGVQDNGEPGIGSGYIMAGNYYAIPDSNGHYNIIVPDGTYTVYYCAQNGYSFTIPVNTPNPNGVLNTCASYTVTITNGTLCGFNFGLQNNHVTICGTVYFDANNNHTQDNSENGIANVHVYVVASNQTVYNAYTDQNGDYCVILPAGTYTVYIGTTIAGGTVTPTTISVAATTIGTSYDNNDFGVYTQPGSCNLSIDITPHTTVTAGFPAWYDIEVCNMGGNITSGTVNMFYDNSLTFSNASPVQTSHNASTHTLSWTLTNLLPGQCEYYWVDFDANVPLQLGQFVFTLANVITSGCQDINMANNVDTIHQAVTGSWDPNNKLAYVTNYEQDPAFQIVSSQNANQRIEYVINFQNTGTAPAVNVVVKDLISSDLDINSFELLGASHAMTATLSGSDVNFKFNAIMLPDMHTDEPNSHGWVKFALNALNGLPGGHVISDEADIYFDYNDAVTTNDAAVTLLEMNGIDDVAVNATLVVYPNPISTTAVFKLNSAIDGFKLRVHDMSGRLVREEFSNTNTMTFDKENLAAGIYTYQILQGNTTSAKGKMVIE